MGKRRFMEGDQNREHTSRGYMKPFVTQLKRIGKSVRNVFRTIGELLMLVLKLTISPLLWIWRLLD